MPSSTPRRMAKGMLSWWITSGLFCLLIPQRHHCHYLPLPASPALFLHQSQALVSQTLGHNFINDKLQWQLVLYYNHRCMYVTHAIDTCSMRICYITKNGTLLTRNCNRENFFPSLMKRQHLHFLCLCKCLHPLFVEESRGCNVWELQTARKVCHTWGPTDKNNHFATSTVSSSLHEFALVEAVTLPYLKW